MEICPKCGKELDNNTRFCNACGTEILKAMYCPKCGTKNSVDNAFCQECGTALVAKKNVTLIQKETMKTKFVQRKNYFKILKEKKVIVAVGIGLIALVAFVMAGFGTSKIIRKDDYAIFLEGNELIYKNLTNDESIVLSSGWLDLFRMVGFPVEELPQLTTELGIILAFSDDGKKLFYQYPASPDDESWPLYYRDMDQSKKEAIKIDSDVWEYMINPEGNQVIYLKGDGNGELYCYDLKGREKIASDVQEFCTTRDCKKVFYWTADGDCCLWSMKTGREKIASNVTEVVNTSDDLSLVYYMKDGSLYKHDLDVDEEEKIASDVDSVIAAYDSGELYYLKKETVQIPYSDFVENIEQEFQKKFMEYDFSELYYFDGKEESVITNRLVEYHSAAKDRPVIVFEHCNLGNISKDTYSGDIDVYAIESYIRDIIESSQETCLAVDSSISVIGNSNDMEVNLAWDGSKIYFVDSISDDGYGDLYQMDISDGIVGNLRLCDSDVYRDYFGDRGYGNKKLVYFKNLDGYSGTLFVNGEKIADDVSCGYGDVQVINDTLYYLNFDEEEQHYTLNMWENGEITKVDHVLSVGFTKGGDIMYLSDDSNKHYAGELYWNDDGLPELISDDVSGIPLIIPRKFAEELEVHYGIKQN